MTDHIIAFVTGFTVYYAARWLYRLIKKHRKQKRLKRVERELTESYGQKLLEFKIKNPEYHPPQGVSAFMTVEEYLQSNRFNPFIKESDEKLK